MASSSTELLPVLAVAVVISSVLLISATADDQQSEYGPCSRSCGGGIAYKTVVCPSDSGVVGSTENSNCTPGRSYMICNTQDCPDGTGDYQDLRKDQCSRYDSEPFSGQLYTWKPYLDVADKCRLFCSATGSDGERLYHKFSDDVINGTPCDRTGNSICVDGACLPVWCDGSVGSVGKQNDACLECGGNGKNCLTEHGTVNTGQMTTGYQELVTIPAGATSIIVREDGPSSNFIAVRDSEGNYYLNGDGVIATYPESVEMGGALFEYQRHNAGIEYLSAEGPLTETLVFELVKRSESGGASVSYEYSHKLESQEPFVWVASAWSNCNASCGDGWLNREVTCTNTESGQVVNDMYCPADLKLRSTQYCNHGNCTGSWKIGEWGQCSAVCGAGFQTRAVGCEETYDSSEPVDTELCDEKLRPIHRKECDTMTACHQWTTGPWSKCSQSCGSGEQTRQVHCAADTSAASGSIPAEGNCDVTTRPSERKTCNVGPCNGAEWMTSGWSGCPCSGTETRALLCINKDGHVLQNDDCDLSTQPPTSRHCTPPAGAAGDGGQSCSTTPSHWFTSQWSKCSAACGGGKRHRTLMCFIGGKLTPSSECENDARPYVTEDCNMQPCDDDHLIAVTDVKAKGCHASVHGCCPDGITAAEGPHHLGCQASNDPIQDGACIETEFGCCPDGTTVAQGPSFKGCEVEHSSCTESEFGCCPDGKTPALGSDDEGCDQADDAGENLETESVTEPRATPTVSPTATDDEMTEVKEETIVPSKFDKLGQQEAEEEVIIPVKAEKQGDEDEVAEEIIVPVKVDKLCREGSSGEGCSPVHVDTDDDAASGEVDELIPPPRTVGLDQSAHPTHPTSPDESAAECQLSAYGCCSDGVTAADGPGHEGCSDGAEESSGEAEVDCQQSRYGCCGDGVTPARGPRGFGCEPRFELEPETGCARTTYGCCIDGKTAAGGPQFAGCQSEADRNYRSSCTDEPYGCCPDGVTAATGPEHAGCYHRLRNAAICSQPKEQGSCTNYSIHWYYDSSYGDCQRFWFGGCDGNENRFESKEQCRNHCISPPEDSFQRCFLPQTAGRCRDTRYRYYYNHEQSQCEEFIYGGCLGNDNNFDTIEQCQNTCIEPLKPSICRQPAQHGPCQGSYKRWYFDRERDSCVEFSYGGCLGNDNRFDSLEECEGRCIAAAIQICSMEKDPGPCDATFYRWYFDKTTGQCQEFVFHGCRGNGNRFLTEPECEHTCAKLITRKTVNRCNMPHDSGKCKAHFQRWYYDRNDGNCKQFVYGGCGGNENRFDSEPHCRETCNARTPVDICLIPVEVTTHCSDTSSSNPTYYFDGHVGQCVEYVTGSCASNDNQFESLESCRKTCSTHLSSPGTDTPANERCLLPRDPGPCLAALIRWHYSTMDGRCVRFEYGGCGGNRNRFMTEEMCNSECHTISTTAMPPVTAAELPADKSETDGDKWEPDYETETPTQFPTDGENGGAENVETDDVCRLKPETGPCTTFVHQWYYNTASQSCKQFLYGGCEGNGNRFETKDECDRSCQHEDLCTQSPVAGSCAAQISMYYYDRATDRCLQFVYGGCGGNDNRFDTRDACEQRCRAAKTPASGLAICSGVVDPGSCRASIPKWHYDTETGECMEFAYGGCDGNSNRFDSEEECRQSCPVTSICQLPSDVGPCRAAKPRYFYDVSTGSCQQFIYGGCSGNANRFLTLENCRRVCDGLEFERTTPRPSVDDNADVCSLKEDTGPCADYQLAWYFDFSETQACRQFWYGGCEGNGNRFETEEQCNNRCTHPETVATESPSSETTVKDVEEKGAACLVKPDAGPCADYQLFWHFEAETQNCQQFWYGGCEGNGNRFETEDQCMASCFSSSVPEVDSGAHSTAEIHPPRDSTTKPTQRENENTVEDVCTSKKDEGEYCTGWELFWYFDVDGGECRVFYYGGCAGNGNRFTSEEDCTKRCKDSESEQPRDLGLTTTTEAAVRDETEDIDEYDMCILTPSAGPCNDQIVRWYWDQSRESCDQFTYGGCEGNENNFDSEEDCHAACGTGLSHPEPETTPDWPHEGEGEPPVILEQDDLINSYVGEMVTLPCLARGSPQPVITWFRNGQPITDRRMSTTSDGSLSIYDAQSLDSATYTCQAKNNAGSTTHAYTLIVNVPGVIEDSDTTGQVTSSVGSNALLPCVVTGSPLPTVRWTRNGVDVEMVDSHLQQLDNGLQIYNVQSEDGGGYICEAWNGFGEPQRKQIILRIEDTVSASVQSVNNTNSYMIRQTVVLACSSNTDSAKLTWLKDGQQLRPIGSRIRFTDDGQLIISDVTKGDSGNYSCTASVDRQSATSPAFAVQVQVAPVWRATTPKPEEVCVDKPWYANCELIVEADLCNHAYFSVFCCKSCHDAGKLHL